MDEINKSSGSDITLSEIIQFVKSLWRFLWSRWVIIVIFGLGGALLGFTASFIIKPKYTAHLSFALNEKSSGGGLATLASSFGITGLLGAGGGDAFTGDNLIEIIKSRYAIEKTLLTPVEFEGEKVTLIDAYIKFSNFSEKWQKAKNKELRELKYPVNQDRNTFTRTQDSVLYEIVKSISGKKKLDVYRKNKKINVVYVNLTTKNEEFSKLFVDNLMDQTYEFYKETRTAQSKMNIDKMQHTADSIKMLYESALYRSAGISQININTASQLAVVPRLKEEYNVQLYGAVYAEVLKNLETLKLDMARETPIVQIIDKPIYPLKVVKWGKMKGLVIGGMSGGLLIVLYLFGVFYLKKML
jgi:hypothetical protein